MTVTTKVVLQNYGGTMNVLDTRNGGSDFKQPAMIGPVGAVGGGGGK